MALGPFQTSVLLGTGAVALAPGASVTVRRSADGSLVQLYDAYEDGSPVGNPVQADAEGFVRVWTEADTYDITITNGEHSRTLDRFVIVDYLAATGRNLPDPATGTAGDAIVVNEEQAGFALASIVESGSNSNGEYVRYSDGTLICTTVAALTYRGGFYIQYDWVFPVEPVSVRSLVCMSLGSFSGVTPHNTQTIPSAGINSPITSGRLIYFRIGGTADFVSGDSLSCSGLMIGRWK